MIAASGLLIAHALVPLSVARRSGRTVARPRSAVTGAGVGCLVAGTAGVAWSLAQHVEAAPEGGYELGTLAPEYLLRTGPYRFTPQPDVCVRGDAVGRLDTAVRRPRPGRPHRPARP